MSPTVHAWGVRGVKGAQKSVSPKVLQNASQGSRTISDHVEVLGRVKEASRGTLEHFGGDRLFGPSDPPDLPRVHGGAHGGLGAAWPRQHLEQQYKD